MKLITKMINEIIQAKTSMSKWEVGGERKLINQDTRNLKYSLSLKY